MFHARSGARTSSMHLPEREFQEWVDAYWAKDILELFRLERRHVYADRRDEPVAIECKWSANDFDPGGLQAFRRRYPTGSNFVVAQDVRRAFSKPVFVAPDRIP